MAAISASWLPKAPYGFNKFFQLDANTSIFVQAFPTCNQYKLLRCGKSILYYFIRKTLKIIGNGRKALHGSIRFLDWFVCAELLIRGWTFWSSILYIKQTSHWKDSTHEVNVNHIKTKWNKTNVCPKTKSPRFRTNFEDANLSSHDVAFIWKLSIFVHGVVAFVLKLSTHRQKTTHGASRAKPELHWC